MKTISVSALKARLSAQLREVKAGETVVVLDHRHPVAKVVPLEQDTLFVRESKAVYSYRTLKPLTVKDPLEILARERGDRW